MPPKRVRDVVLCQCARCGPTGQEIPRKRAQSHRTKELVGNPYSPSKSEHQRRRIVSIEDIEDGSSDSSSSGAALEAASMVASDISLAASSRALVDDESADSALPLPDPVTDGLTPPNLLDPQPSVMTSPLPPESDEESDSDISDEDDGQSDVDLDWSQFNFMPADRLSEWDQLGEEVDREFASLGEKLAFYDLAICKAFSYKVKSHTTDKAWPMINQAFPQEPPLPKLDALRSRVAFLAGFKPEAYDCCPNSCMCYTPPHDKLDRCFYCQEPRLRADKKPRKRFMYIPLAPRLIAFASHEGLARLGQYRSQYKHQSGHVADVFDGTLYRALQKMNIQVRDEQFSDSYFSDPRDVALGLSTDGFAPFKTRKQTAWPLIIFNYNLPPEIRFHLSHIMSLGVIPGPKKPKDFDSFLWPLVQELLRLAKGVAAFDVLQSARFALRAFLILIFGDMPAIAMAMRMKGHNGYSPCRMCHITGVRIPNSNSSVHYVPLNRSTHPSISHDPTAVQNYDPHALPLRQHDEFLSQADEVDMAVTNVASEQLARQYGIKGRSILTHLHSIRFPHSFPYDFMHLIWENVVKNLILLWTGEFKGLGAGTEHYEVSKAVWQAIGTKTRKSGDFVPSAYGSRVPNIIDEGGYVSAEMWSFWFLYLGPIYLHRKFKKDKYYNHFIRLVVLLNTCLQFDLTRDDVDNLEDGFAQWVVDYEKYYYQHDSMRLSTCPVTIHALLHIASSIRAAGPVWCYWAFPMERYCGKISPAIRSRRFPFASIDRYMLEEAQLTQIGAFYNVVDELALRLPSNVDGLVRSACSDAHYPTCILLPPKSTQRPKQLKPIIGALVTRFNSRVAVVSAALKDAIIEEWGKVHRIDSKAGDTMSTAYLGERMRNQPDDHRDATFVRYDTLVDRHARTARAIELEEKTFYGQLEHIYRISFLDGCEALGIHAETSIILAAVRQCKEMPSLNIPGLGFLFYSHLGALDVVDITCLQSLVARVDYNGKTWAIVDRTSALQLSTWIDEPDDEVTRNDTN